MDRLRFQGNLQMTIDFGTVLDAVIAHAELAESGQIRRHADEPAMHHASGVVREPLDFAFHSRADGGVQPGELRVGLAAYFDLVGHGW